MCSATWLFHRLALRCHDPFRWECAWDAGRAPKTQPHARPRTRTVQLDYGGAHHHSDGALLE
jgi:hypothetical protein